MTFLILQGNNMKGYLNSIIIILLLVSSCKEEVCLYPSNKVYIAVTTNKDSIIVDFAEGSDTLLKYGGDIYDTSGRLFMTTLKDTMIYLNDEGDLKRRIKKDKDNRYTSTTFGGICWVERTSVRTYTFDENNNILDIYAPGYLVSYVSEENVLPLKHDTGNTVYYYPNREELGSFIINYQEEGFTFRGKYWTKASFRRVNDEIYDSEGRLFLSNRRDTTIINVPTSPHLANTVKCVLGPIEGYSEDYFAQYFIKRDTAFSFFIEYVYDKKYRMRMIRQPQVAKFERPTLLLR